MTGGMNSEFPSWLSTDGNTGLGIGETFLDVFVFHFQAVSEGDFGFPVKRFSGGSQAYGLTPDEGGMLWVEVERNVFPGDLDDHGGEFGDGDIAFPSEVDGADHFVVIEFFDASDDGFDDIIDVAEGAGFASGAEDSERSLGVFDGAADEDGDGGAGVEAVILVRAEGADDASDRDFQARMLDL